MQTITRTSDIRAVGLCHSVQGTFDQLMGYIGEDPRRSPSSAPASTTWRSISGWKRTAWISTRASSRRWTQPEVYNTNKVRFELMQRLGYFVTESSEHNAEYSPYFIPHGRDDDRQIRACRSTNTCAAATASSTSSSG